MKYTQPHYNYVALYKDGFKIGRTKNPLRRMRQIRAMAFDLGSPVSDRVALHTETHIRRILKRFAIPGTFEFFESSMDEAFEVIDFTARTQTTLKESGV
jgi:hypothetical protein